MWSWWFVDTVTGVKQLEVTPKGGSWSRFLNTDASGSHEFHLADRALPRETWWGLTTPWARTLVQCWNDTPVWAGVVTGRPYARGTRVLTVRHADLRAIFKRRYPFGVPSYWADEANRVPGKLVITNKSLVAAAATVLQQGMLGPVGAATYTLPVVLPSTGTAGGFSTVYENFNFQKVTDILDELQSMDGGPDIEFSPRWGSSGALEWVARVGSLSGNSFDWHLDAKSSPVASAVFEEDALNQATGVFGIGQGSGADMVVGGTPWATVANIPAQDVTVSWKHVKTDVDAASLAREHLSTLTYSTRLPELKVRASVIDPTMLVLGSTIRLHDQDDPWLPDGWTDYRLVGVAGGVGEELTLTVERA